ncbi:hypothetical protein GCM10027048_45050 [Hymenobacter coalescens]
MKQTVLLTLTALLSAGAAQAQSAITINQGNFPATTATVERFQDVTLPVARPATGANQTWNYASVVPTGAVDQSTYIAPPANAAFPTATRAYNYTVDFGPAPITGVQYQSLNAQGLQDLGFALRQQRIGLQPTTGVRTDSLIIPAQQVTYSNSYIVKFPLTAGSVQRNSYRSASRGILTAQLLQLNRAQVTLVQRVSQIDSVAGWGTVRLPAVMGSGATAPIPALLRRTRFRQVDSVYVDGQPASPFLLLILGVQQGQESEGYFDMLFRANSAQPLAFFSYDDDTYQTVDFAQISREANLVTSARNALATAVGGLQAYPNPTADGRLTVALGNGRQQPVELTVRDLTGRPVRTAPATTGQPSEALRGLPAGTYLVEVQDRSGASSALKVTVQ